jgi:hypothetical protein
MERRVSWDELKEVSALVVFPEVAGSHARLRLLEVPQQRPDEL